MSMESRKPLRKLYFYKIIYIFLSSIIVLLDIEYNELSNGRSSLLLIATVVGSFLIDQKLKKVVDNFTNITKSFGEYGSVIIIVALVTLYVFNISTGNYTYVQDNIVLLYIVFLFLFFIQILDWFSYGNSDSENEAFTTAFKDAEEIRRKEKMSKLEAEEIIKDAEKEFKVRKSYERRKRKSKSRN